MVTPCGLQSLEYSLPGPLWEKCVQTPVTVQNVRGTLMIKVKCSWYCLFFSYKVLESNKWVDVNACVRGSASLKAATRQVLVKLPPTILSYSFPRAYFIHFQEVETKTQET